MVALSLAGRLLCAAQQAYEINQAGPIEAPNSPTDPPTAGAPMPPPSSLVGWVAPAAMAIETGVQNINAVLVGETAAEIIVAFRGTEPFDSTDKVQMVLDWIDDLDAELVVEPGFPGKIHQGFRDGLNQLWPFVLDEVQKRASPKKQLRIVGHSKGGALANLAAYKLAALNNPNLTPYVTTFEAARCGDAEFAAGYAKLVTHATRFEYQDDIVPHLPPEDTFLAIFNKIPFMAEVLQNLEQQGGYVPVGDLNFINWQNQIVTVDTPALEASRLAHIAELLLMFDAAKVIDDHSIAPFSGMADVICPGVWVKPAAAAA